jgi:hypothetical protein
MAALAGNDSALSTKEERGDMGESNFMHGWVALIGSLATIALILMALGLMLGIVKPADAMNRVGAILGIVIVLIFIPSVLASAWSGMSMWQRLALAAIGLALWQWRRPRRRTRKRSEE